MSDTRGNNWVTVVGRVSGGTRVRGRKLMRLVCSGRLAVLQVVALPDGFRFTSWFDWWFRQSKLRETRRKGS